MIIISGVLQMINIRQPSDEHICHENRHDCEFPDLYSYIDGQGIVGNYSLMCASGSTHPRNVDPYLKYKAGWADVVEVNAASNVRAVAQIDRNFYYKFTNPVQSKEYFLIENRDDIGYEGVYGGASVCAPGQGLVCGISTNKGGNTSSIQKPADLCSALRRLLNQSDDRALPLVFRSDLILIHRYIYSGHGANPQADILPAPNSGIT